MTPEKMQICKYANMQMRCKFFLLFRRLFRVWRSCLRTWSRILTTKSTSCVRLARAAVGVARRAISAKRHFRSGSYSNSNALNRYFRSFNQIELVTTENARIDNKDQNCLTKQANLNLMVITCIGEVHKGQNRLHSQANLTLMIHKGQNCLFQQANLNLMVTICLEFV